MGLGMRLGVYYRGFREIHLVASSKHLFSNCWSWHIPIFESPSVLCQAMIQCPACLPDAVHHPFAVSLGQGLSDGPIPAWESECDESMQGGKYACANLSTQGAPVPGCNSLRQDQQVFTCVAMNLINNYQPTLELELASYQHQLWVIQRNKHYHTPIHPYTHTCTLASTHAHTYIHMHTCCSTTNQWSA